MAITISAKKYATGMIKAYGALKAKELVSISIEELSEKGMAHTNIHQLKFLIRVLDNIIKVE